MLEEGACRAMACSRVSGVMSLVATTEMTRSNRLTDATWNTSCGAGNCTHQDDDEHLAPSGPNNTSMPFNYKQAAAGCSNSSMSMTVTTVRFI